MSQTQQHIVVVDDELPAREMIGDYLRMHGFTVTLCDSGISLRQSIAEQMPDLIVLDLNMPEEDGLSIIRDLKRRMSVPIIMLTATASAIDRVVGLELGADDYLAKPCELRELLARVRSVLRRSVAVSPPAAQPTQPAAAPKAPDRTLVRFGTKWLDQDAQTLRDDRATSTRSPPRNTGCSRCSRPIPSGCFSASGCSSSPMPATQRRSIGRSICGSCESAGKSSRIRRIRRSFAPSAAAAICFPRPAKHRRSTEPNILSDGSVSLTQYRPTNYCRYFDTLCFVATPCDEIIHPCDETIFPLPRNIQATGVC